MALHDAASKGELSLEKLNDYRSGTARFDIDQPDDRGRSALAHAAMKGHTHVVKLLVKEGADVNRRNDKNRSALWYASLSHPSVTQQRRLEVVEHLLCKGANPNIQAQDGTTALMKLIEHREPSAIKLLVRYGASLQVVVKDQPVTNIEDLARNTNDPAVINALKLQPGQVSVNNEVVTDIVTYVLKSIGFMNTVVGGIRRLFKIQGDLGATLKCTPVNSNAAYTSEKETEAYRNRIHVDGPGNGSNAKTSLGFGLEASSDTNTLAMNNDKDDVPPVTDKDYIPPVTEISELTTPAQFKASMTKYINESGLADFFPEDSDFLQRVAEKAAELKLKPKNYFKKSKDVENCTKLALYQPVFYCDDSGSMNHGTRKDDQDELVKRVARISTCLVPDGCGTGLQFINDKRPMNKDLSVQEVTEIMQSIEPHGNTKIGTHLEKKILKPLIYDVVKKGGRLERPILVSCITDGCAKGEAREKFQQTILKCVKFLREHGYPETAIRFQISQIGNDEEAESFLRELRDDKELKDILFCTTKRLDEEYQKLHENEEDLERWLLETLVEPILRLGSN